MSLQIIKCLLSPAEKRAPSLKIIHFSSLRFAIRFSSLRRSLSFGTVRGGGGGKEEAKNHYVFG